MDVENRATISDVRAPYHTRTNTSEALTSTPNQKSFPGPLGNGMKNGGGPSFRPLLMKTWLGPLWVQWAISGEMAAMTIMKITKKMPTNASLSPLNRAQKRSQGLRPTTCWLGSPPLGPGSA